MFKSKYFVWNTQKNSVLHGWILCCCCFICNNHKNRVFHGWMLCVTPYMFLFFICNNHKNRMFHGWMLSHTCSWFALFATIIRTGCSMDGCYVLPHTCSCFTLICNNHKNRVSMDGCYVLSHTCSMDGSCYYMHGTLRNSVWWTTGWMQCLCYIIHIYSNIENKRWKNTSRQNWYSLNESF